MVTKSPCQSTFGAELSQYHALTRTCGGCANRVVQVKMTIKIPIRRFSIPLSTLFDDLRGLLRFRNDSELIASA